MANRKRKSKKNASKAMVVYEPKQPKTPKARKRSRGTGQSVGRLGVLLRNLGGLGGHALSSAIPALGAMGVNGRNGWNLGASLSKWLGSGDYAVSSNSIVSAANNGQLAGMHSNSQSIIVRHKEYIGDVVTSATPGVFLAQIYSLNPGTQTFPWLANICSSFQEYQWKGLVFEYKGTSATAIASTTNVAMGTVMMATQYRASAAPFIAKTDLLQEFFSSDGRNYEDFCHPIECKPKENQNRVFYIRQNAVPAGEDIKTYDLGTFTVATQGFPGASQNVGELWATYEVELFKPQLPVGGISASSSYLHIWSSSNITTANIWGSPYVVIQNTDLAVVTATTITYPYGALSGNYMLVWIGRSNGSALGEVAGGFTSASAGVVALTAVGNGGGANLQSTALTSTSVYTVAGSSYFQCVQFFTITPTLGVNPSFGPTGGAWTLANMLSADLYIVQIPTAY